MKFNDLSLQWKTIENDALPGILSVLNTGNFILGSSVGEFETEFAKWNGNSYAIGVANGTDALKICIASLSLKGKTKFYVPSNTYIATLLGVVFSMVEDYEYELVDCDEYYQIDCSLLEKSIRLDHKKYDNLVVMPVHLYGHCCDMKKLMSLKKEYNFKMVEDCSQSHGTITEDGKKVGCYGEVSAFSLYPGKNIGAAGDAGIVVTNDSTIRDRCLFLRNLGSVVKYKHEVIGWNSRLDTIQAVILIEKLKHIDRWNEERIKIAFEFANRIKNKHIKLPVTSEYCKKNTYHIYPILTEHRNDFMDHLANLGVPTLIHYPISIEKTNCFMDENANSKNTLLFSTHLVSLPMHPFLTSIEVSEIIDAVNSFVPKNETIENETIRV